MSYVLRTLLWPFYRALSIWVCQPMVFFMIIYSWWTIWVISIGFVLAVVLYFWFKWSIVYGVSFLPHISITFWHYQWRFYIFHNDAYAWYYWPVGVCRVIKFVWWVFNRLVSSTFTISSELRGFFLISLGCWGGRYWWCCDCRFYAHTDCRSLRWCVWRSASISYVANLINDA